MKDSVRNPTVKRGRPRKENSVRRILVGFCRSRNQVDMLSALDGLAPGLAEELLPLADQRKTTVGVLAYVARFPWAQQRRMFEVLNALGTRGAKRYVECLYHPPGFLDVARRLGQWLRREFPGVDHEVIVQGLRSVLFRLAPAPQAPPKKARGKKRGGA
jgi:hypothetical protein